ncbi:MAG: hypothetical protein R2765_08985 [Ferruginibacter sp.]
MLYRLRHLQLPGLQFEASPSIFKVMGSDALFTNLFFASIMLAYTNTKSSVLACNAFPFSAICISIFSALPR